MSAWVGSPQEVHHSLKTMGSSRSIAGCRSAASSWAETRAWQRSSRSPHTQASTAGGVAKEAPAAIVFHHSPKSRVGSPPESVTLSLRRPSSRCQEPGRAGSGIGGGGIPAPLPHLPHRRHCHPDPPGPHAPPGCPRRAANPLSDFGIVKIFRVQRCAGDAG